jgi:AraC family transcriptional regulator of adaptative response/methylated-DNA-[protein]-cysteine methyltransferase
MSDSRHMADTTGLTIRYGIATSATGLALAGLTGTGVCTVMLGDDEGELVAALAREFPAATLVRGAEIEDTAASAVAAYVAGAVDMPEMALDPRGTSFQQRVWAALRRVPAGSTATYADIARGIGSPSAYRAVANACAGNHIAVLVPCHRVVRADGGLGGYKWGVERKQRLLEREGARR